MAISEAVKGLAILVDEMSGLIDLVASLLTGVFADYQFWMTSYSELSDQRRVSHGRAAHPQS
jgi:hypothetical protein